MLHLISLAFINYLPQNLGFHLFKLEIGLLVLRTWVLALRQFYAIYRFHDAHHLGTFLSAGGCPPPSLILLISAIPKNFSLSVGALPA